MPGKQRRVSALAIGVGIAAIIAIVLVIVLLIEWLKPGPTPPVVPGPSSSSAPPSSSAPARPESQPASCPDVEVIAVPGTWESKSTDDPLHPTANPNSLILKVSGPLQKAYPSPRAEVWTTPYVAQLSNPVAIPPDGQATYQVSRTEGDKKTRAQIEKVYAKCKLTSFLLMGFSQGAVIAGDIASDIGNGRGPIPSENVLGVGLISDGRRVPGEAKSVGPNPPGVGAEVAFKGLAIGGLELRGPRAGGFGDLGDKTYSLCGQHDPICNEPKDIFDANAISQTLPKVQAVLTANSHALYATTKDWIYEGESAVQWMNGWADGLVSKAPKPKHS
ncbi:cutinase family protein [Tsukamurella sp. 8F]|uniref:cutinase family protein n=1 Tax=unclassified Tsukamurella TaxID=2633480 RepID=UPI0023B8B12C|nr:MULTISPECIES: cutinase family protein [unclassified Tsukamurella]MDF0530783.1 cutinase family protein [Tsukamurella sp. 8J]MDF0588309.1 cutinase family protein [Tsukamurella sp. 8F]